MAVTSSIYDTVSYPANTWDDLYVALFSPGDATKAAVIKGIGGNLAVSGATSPVAVAAGQAVANGKRVVNSASMNVAIPTPVTNPRIDRIIIKVDYTVDPLVTDPATIERKAGTEAASPVAPTLTQTDGTLWEVSLAQVYITTGGAITITNERVWARPRGIFTKGEFKWCPATLGGPSNKYMIDPDLGSYDPDWALADGGTYNGYATLDMRGRMVIAQDGATYIQGTSYGSATINIQHNHAITGVTVANESGHTHAVSGNTGNESSHTHGAGSYQAASHTHGYGTLSTNNGGPTTHTVSSNMGGLGVGTESYVLSVNAHSQHTHGVTSGATGAQSAAVSGTSGAGSTHAHTVSITSAAGSAHNHGLSGNVANGLSTAQSVLNPCLAVACFQYCPAS